jgi:hypothetical protein
MKILIFGIILYAAGFATAYFWEADREKHVSETYALTQRMLGFETDERKKDTAILRKTEAARDKICDYLGIPREDHTDGGWAIPDGTPTPTPTPTP